jgi:hypothetical protein
MKDRHRGQNGPRAQALATHDRSYWLGLLQNVETWWPVYRFRHPEADRAEVVARLAKLIDGRRRRGFSEQEPARPSALPDSALLFERPRITRGLTGETGFPGSASGVVQASDFKWYDVETKSKPDTQDLHVVAPLGAPDWAGSHGASFWAGFTRTDSTWDQVDILSDSPSDRVVHMAVMRITLPPPTSRVTAVLRASLFLSLHQGVEIINDWGWLDDQDSASFKIDLCGAFLNDADGFPDPPAFGFTSVFTFGSSSHNSFSTEVDVTRTVLLSPGDRPSLYLGIRLTFAAADSRIQTGFTQEALDARFGFRHPDHGARGLFYSYIPDPVFEQ